jgi:hypothetical protein
MDRKELGMRVRTEFMRLMISMGGELQKQQWPYPTFYGPRSSSTVFAVVRLCALPETSKTSPVFLRGAILALYSVVSCGIACTVFLTKILIMWIIHLSYACCTRVCLMLRDLITFWSSVPIIMHIWVWAYCSKYSTRIYITLSVHKKCPQFYLLVL